MDLLIFANTLVNNGPAKQTTTLFSVGVARVYRFSLIDTLKYKEIHCE